MDDRLLRLSESSSGSGGATGGARNDEGGPSGSGGAEPDGAPSSGGAAGASGGGPGSTPDGEAPPCSEPDCGNVVYNPHFDYDIVGWDPEPTVTVEWDTPDADGLEWSGSISVRNEHQEQLDGMTATGARQCAPATPGAIYNLRAKVAVGVAEGSGSGHMSVVFFASADCKPPALPKGGFTTSSGARIDQWDEDRGQTTAPSEAHSIAVRLVATKPLKDPPLKVVFDEISVREE